jgi:hypothetical protein
MATYDMDEGRLVVPDGWEDRTLNSLEYDGREGTLKVIMTRHTHRGRKLGKMVEAVLEDMRRRLAGYELVSMDEILLDGEPAVEARVRFTDDGAAFEQRSIWMLVGPKCVATGVVSQPATAVEAASLFETIKTSLRRRPRDADESEMIPPAPPVGPPPDPR